MMVYTVFAYLPREAHEVGVGTYAEEWAAREVAAAHVKEWGGASWARVVCWQMLNATEVYRVDAPEQGSEEP